MKLEIRNLQTSATYEIDPEGAVLGREGSKADIVLRDQAVSKKHAKIYEKNGRWYLEDLASSNGTFIDNRRITEPVVLTVGAVFSLSENQFEVVQIGNGANGKAAFDDVSGDGGFQDPLDDLPPLGMTGGDDSQAEGKKGGRGMGKNQAAGRAGGASRSRAPEADEPMDEQPEELSVGYFLVAVPKAIAYFLANVPLMILNPPGRVRKGIEEQRFPPMRWMQLAAYAMPVTFFVSLAGIIASMISLLLNGTFTFPLVPAIIAAVTAIVSGLISGLIWHPVVKWIVNFLKGESDEKSRTNYFMAVYTGLAITGVASLTTVLGALPIPVVGPLLGIVPVLITLAASLISVYILYSWLKHFGVVDWALKVVMVIGVLTLLGAGFGVVNAVIAAVRSLGSGGTPAIAQGTVDPNLTAEQKEALAKAQELAKQAQAAAGAAGADAEAQAKKAQEEAAKALAATAELAKKAQEEAAKQAAGAQADAAKAGAEATKQAEAAAQEAAKAGAEATKQAEAAAQEAAKAGAEATKKAEEAARKAEEASKKAAAEAAKKHEDAEAGGEEATATSGEHTAFETFLEKREACFKAIERDPFLLKQKDIRDRYERLLRATDEVRQRWAKKKSKDFAESKINDRLKDIEVYEATAKMVEQLHARMFSK